MPATWETLTEKDVALYLRYKADKPTLLRLSKVINEAYKGQARVLPLPEYRYGRGETMVCNFRGEVVTGTLLGISKGSVQIKPDKTPYTSASKYGKVYVMHDTVLPQTEVQKFGGVYSLALAEIKKAKEEQRPIKYPQAAKPKKPEKPVDPYDVDLTAEFN